MVVVMFCKWFGCNFISIKKEEHIEVLWKTRYTFYEECTRCKAKINFNSYTQ